MSYTGVKADRLQLIGKKSVAADVMERQVAQRGIRNQQPATTTSHELFQKIKRGNTQCIRLTLLQAFVITGMDTASKTHLENRTQCASAQVCVQCLCPFCTCCSYCRSQCKCSCVFKVICFITLLPSCEMACRLTF